MDSNSMDSNSMDSNSMSDNSMGNNAAGSNPVKGNPESGYESNPAGRRNNLADNPAGNPAGSSAENAAGSPTCNPTGSPTGNASGGQENPNSAYLCFLTVVKFLGLETTVSQGDWSMTCNYTPAKTMGGLYGVVNANSNIQRGGTSSTLDGLTAYFTYTGTKSLVKAVVSYLDADGTPLGITSATLHDEASESYFSPTGQQLSAPQHGITIVRKADGSVRKLLCR